MDMPTKREILPKSFYQKDTCTIAKELLGKILVHNSSEGSTAGIITETEAYLQNDEACHASRGMTPRTVIMFGPPGYAYIYFTYGMHYLFNVVTSPKGVGEAVLIRALEPVEGLELMRDRRGLNGIRELCSGPAKLVQAMGIKPDMYGHDLAKEPLFIINGDNISKEDLVTTTRIGISVAEHLPLRFYIKDNKFISRK